MANQTVYPYGTNGSLPSSVGIINDLTTGGADKALSAEQGKKLGQATSLLAGIEFDSVEKIYELSGWWEAANGTWAKINSSIIHLYKVAAGSLYKINVEENDDLPLFYLKSFSIPTASTTAPDFCEGFSFRVNLAAGSENTIQTPFDCNYIAIGYRYGAVGEREYSFLMKPSVKALIDTKIAPVSGPILEPTDLAGYWPSSSGVWAYKASHITHVYNVIPGEAYRISAATNSHDAVPVFFLKTNPAPEGNNTPADFSSTYQFRVTVSVGESIDISIPDDCYYIATGFVYIDQYYYEEVKLLGNISVDAIVKCSRPDKVVYVAANNSSDSDKNLADYVCSGANDEVIINQAIQSLGGTGKIVLLNGKYYIGGFNQTTGYSRPTAIGIPYQSDNQSITIEGIVEGGGIWYPRELANLTGAIIVVPSTTLSSVSVQSSVIAAASGNVDIDAFAVNIRNLKILFDNGNSPVIGIDCEFFGSSILENLRLYSSAISSLSLPNSQFVGIRGYTGFNFGCAVEWKHIDCVGFYIGFQIGAEHLVCTELKTHWCYYGYTFDDYPISHGVLRRPITLINCCSESDCSLPKFGSTSGEGFGTTHPINIMDFSVELGTDTFTGNVALPAEEDTPGRFSGTITYSMVNTLQNQVNNVAFWKAGSGENVLTRNLGHSFIGNSTTRRGYASNYMQQFFDTALNKLVICIDPDNSTWVDAMGNIV